VKEGWQVRTLGELCDVARGGSPRPIQKFLTEKSDGINWVKIGDATASNKYIYKTEEKIKPEGAKRSRIVKPGDFLLSNSMSFGRPYIMRTTGCIHDGWLVLSDSSGLFDQDYLYYFFGSTAAYKQFDNLAAGSTVRNLNTELVKRVTIPLAPRAEQQRIVAILDEAFAGLATATANAEKNLKNSRELFDSYLNSMLSKGNWEKKRLPEISRDFGRGKSRHRPRNDPKLYGGPYPFVQTGDISSADHWLADYTQTYSALGLAQSRLWPKGTVCIAIVGATVGETAILGFEACFPDSVIGVLIDEAQANPEYVEYLLQAFKAVLKEKGKGTARDNINLGTFENQLFPFPVLKEQLVIVDRLNEMASHSRELEDIYSNKLMAISELRQSILQRAFSGELTSLPPKAINEAAE
jgi:type I restriction enzyme, S subunit